MPYSQGNAMKPSYQLVRQHYPKSEARETCYGSRGWGDIANHNGYKDTCAIRMSYALLRAGVSLPGARMRVNAGVARGKYIEPRQGVLSRILKQIWGAPEVYTSEAAALAGIGNRSGIVSFFKIQGGNGGHIDLVDPSKGVLDCARSCYFSAKETWFWALP